MKPMIKISSVFYVLLLLVVVGCSSQSNSGYSNQNFDQLKAAKTRISLGLTYLKNGNFSQAKFNLDKALEFAPRSADANYALAYYYQNVGELEQAEEAYQFAMDLEPSNADIANSYGAFLCQNGQYSKAKEYFLKAINTSNYVSSAETYENLALCSQSQGHKQDTIQYLRSAINHQPGRASTLFLLVEALVDNESWSEAKTALGRYEKVSQISPRSLLMAIEIENGLGNYASAKGYTDMFIRLFPSDPAVKALVSAKQSSVSKSASARKLNKTLKLPTAEKKESPLKDLSVPKDTNTKLSEDDNVLATIETDSSIDKMINKPADVVVNESMEKSEVMDEANLAGDINQSTASIVKSTGKDANNILSSDSSKQDGALYHVVAKGENLYRISLLYNIKMKRLIEWNNLDDASAIYNGMKLMLAAPNSVE